MPLPKPTTEQSREEFLAVCMLEATEFEDTEQRYAVCLDLYNDTDSKAAETYTDYPEAASNNAKRALDFKESNGSSCGTAVGWTRARQLASREPLSRDTIARMASFKRHQQYKDVPYSEGCGGLMWDAWGGDAGINWAIKKLAVIDKFLYSNLMKELKTKASPDDLSVGDKVSWNASGGTARGVIRRIVRESFDVPDSDFTIEGTEDDPAYAIEIARPADDGGYELTGQIVGHKADALSKVDFEVKKSLSSDWSLYTKGLADQPKVRAVVKLLNTDSGVKAVISKEIEDRDGEVVMIDGINFDKAAGVPLLDAHNMQGSIVDNVLGRAMNIRKKKVNGVMTLEADLDFAATPRAVIAEQLVKGGYVDSVSIGFGVREYDPAKRAITKSELYETSLVAVPANPAAKIDIGAKTLKELEEGVEKVDKKLAHYEEIYPAFKAFTKTFLSDTFTKTLGVSKTGDLVKDIENVYNVLTKRLEAELETPEADTKAKLETPTAEVKTVTVQELQKMIADAISEAV